MLCSAMALGVDGVLAGLALSLARPRRAAGAIALAFGISDAGAAAAGRWLSTSQAADTAGALAILGLAFYLAFRALRGTSGSRLAGQAAWVPILFSLDNLLAGFHGQVGSTASGVLVIGVASALAAFSGATLGGFFEARVAVRAVRRGFR